MKHTLVPVVLCGGSGTRLWPLSRAGYPKQFLVLSGNSSLFQQAASRLAHLGADDLSMQPPLVVGNEEHRFLVLDQLREIGAEPAAVLLEPVGRQQPGGLAVQMAHDAPHALLHLQAPIAPGMVRPVPIASWRRMVADEPLAIEHDAGTVALDGEREIAFEAGQPVTMTLRENAFFTVDVARCMQTAARPGLLRPS